LCRPTRLREQAASDNGNDEEDDESANVPWFLNGDRVVGLNKKDVEGEVGEHSRKQANTATPHGSRQQGEEKEGESGVG
jgi:hypothetical protein